MRTALAQVADSSSNPMQTVVVTAQHLNEERSHIQTQVGASTYTIDSAAIDAAPGRRHVLMNQVMLQVPDAAQELLRSAAYPRRPQWPAVPAQRHHPARRHQRLRPDTAAAADRIDADDHGQPAGAVRPAQRRHHRPHHQERLTGSGGQRHPVRRQPWRARTQLRLRRFDRSLHVFRHRRLPAQRPRHRIPRRQQRSAARSHQAASRLRVPRRRAR